MDETNIYVYYIYTFLECGISYIIYHTHHTSARMTNSSFSIFLTTFITLPKAMNPRVTLAASSSVMVAKSVPSLRPRLVLASYPDARLPPRLVLAWYPGACFPQRAADDVTDAAADGELDCSAPAESAVPLVLLAAATMQMRFDAMESS